MTGLFVSLQGITVGNEEDSDGLTVIRIAPDSATDKQGLIRIGDVIAEVNGVPVHTPDDLGDVIGRSGPDIKFKVLPGGIKKTKGGVYQVCVRQACCVCRCSHYYLAGMFATKPTFFS